jgi:thiosulfate/3-mercaptopyruvate sulfurtransferase
LQALKSYIHLWHMRLIFSIGIGVSVVVVALTVLNHLRFADQTSRIESKSFRVTQPYSLRQTWSVSAEEAVHLIASGATLLDARGRFPNPIKQNLRGALSVQWQDFSPTAPMHRGKLLDDIALLETKIRRLGISNHTPVVVFGDPLHGWGEEGRIVWMLRVLGHNHAVWVDGGIQTLRDADIPTSLGLPMTHAKTSGDFTVELGDRWHITQDQLKQRLDDQKTVLIDTREKREFEGQTPYGEARGGHLPGAIHLYFKEFLRDDGTLLPHDEILMLLKANGIERETPVIAYCTGGIRSAWVTAVLVDLGFSVQNYAGSTWEWAASPAEAYPLSTN